MSSLSSKVNEQLIALASASSSQLAVDVYRAAKEQAELLYQTERVRQKLFEDPFRAFQDLDIELISKSIQVIDYDCVRTRHDYVRIQAQVEIDVRKGGAASTPSTSKLNFLFEREATDELGTLLTYSIDLSTNLCESNRKLLWVQVMAAGRHPSQRPAIDMEDEENGWSDIESDADVHDDTKDLEHEQKRAKIGGTQAGGEDSVEEMDCDRYMAGMDPEVLADLIKAYGGKMDESTAFFLLMCFPFYESEWDMVGFVLASVFRSSCDDNDGDTACHMAIDECSLNYEFVTTET
ncbi:hypothetical protein MPSEU_000789000 [Mayamaea pseudoterrestris]|nr:hypothetical protein MPSEU_000789000 [Mayamaea pseudoterrestris]